MTAKVLVKKNEVARWKQEMKHFASYKHRNEDVLYIHNHLNQYMVCENKEFIQQLELFKELNLELHQHNIKKFNHKGKDYMMITFNGSGLEGTDGDTINAMAFAQGFLVSGFTYVFKYHSYKEIEKTIKKGGYVKYFKKEKDIKK